VTDAATMGLLREVVGGDLSLRVYQGMHKNNLEGLALNAVPSDWMRVELRPKKPIDYGFVGDIKDVFKRPINRLLRVTNFIACPCLTMSREGHLVNINADSVSTELAIGTGAHKLIFLSDVDGVMVNGKTAFMITSKQISQYIKDGTATGGMKVKLENCLRALEGGVKRIHLINGLREDALYKEIYESVSPGTMVLPEEERQNYLNEVEVQKTDRGAEVVWQFLDIRVGRYNRIEFLIAYFVFYFFIFVPLFILLMPVIIHIPHEIAQFLYLPMAVLGFALFRPADRGSEAAGSRDASVSRRYRAAQSALCLGAVLLGGGAGVRPEHRFLEEHFCLPALEQSAEQFAVAGDCRVLSGSDFQEGDCGWRSGGRGG
jgi:acetylglutamate kinase